MSWGSASLRKGTLLTMRCADSNDLSTASDTSFDATGAVFNNQAILWVIAQLFGSKNECCEGIVMISDVLEKVMTSSTHGRGKACHV